MQIRVWALLSVLLLGSGVRPWAQQAASAAGGAAVPTLVQFSGALTSGNGKPLTGLTGVTFSLYAAPEGGAPLWLETQNVQPDKAGNYSVMLGSTTSQGLPASLFVSGQARWLGVQPQGQAEQPRVTLISVPYALKAADAATVGGLPPSAFVLAAPPTGRGGTAKASGAGSSGGTAHPNLGGSGTQSYIPLWTDSNGDLGNSVMYQSGRGSTAKVGINTTNPGSALDVKGKINAANGYNLGGKAFATGSFFNQNAFLGFAGNSSMTGPYNTASGIFALVNNTTGSNNTASGGDALISNTTGSGNTASGAAALGSNTTGANNTATGGGALYNNTTGNNNTASGSRAGFPVDGSALTGANNTFLGSSATPGTGTLSNSTAIGGFAEVDVSNAIVLGSVAGKNGATASPNVGIGTTAPLSTLDVEAAPQRSIGPTLTLTNNTGGGQLSLDFNTYPPNLGDYVPSSRILVSDDGNYSNNIYFQAKQDGNIDNGLNTNVTFMSNGYVGIGTPSPSSPLTVVTNSSYIPLAVQSSSTFGTWMTLGNSSSGGKTWNILSAASGNSEGAGNLAFTNFDSSSTVYLHSNLHVDGNVSKGGGSFQIDHPLDPANKYLYHSFVESPDMMNIYNGNVVTNHHGVAVVVLPDYFEALNRDFRYQLTVMGQFAQAIIARKITNGRFVIRTNKPGVEVSWQVTGIRHDAYADARRIQVEVEKPEGERGHYLHPELFGASEAEGIGSLR